MSQEEPKGFVSRNQRLAIYQNCPGLLAEDLALIMEYETKDLVEVHNFIVKRLKRLCPDYDRMIAAVAKAVIKNITE